MHETHNIHGENMHKIHKVRGENMQKILTVYKIYDNINNGDDYVKKENREKTNCMEK